MALFKPGSIQPDNVTDRGKVERVKLAGPGDTTETTEWVDVALQSELDAHAAAGDPHPTYLTVVEGNAAYEATGGLAAHLADTIDAHDASAVSFVAVGTIAGTDVQTAVAEVATDAAAALASHEADTTAVHGITNTANLYAVGGTDVAVADGGTGSSTAAGARTNLGVVIGTDVAAQSHTQAASTITDFAAAAGAIAVGGDLTGTVSNAQIGAGAVGPTELAALAVTNAKVADDAIGIDELSATGTASSATFLRGDNTWAAPAGGGSADPLDAGFIISGRMFGR